MIKLSIIQKIILAAGTIAFAVRAFTYHPDVISWGPRIVRPRRGYSSPVAMAVNGGIILQCIAIILITALLVFLFPKKEKK